VSNDNSALSSRRMPHFQLNFVWNFGDIIFVSELLDEGSPQAILVRMKHTSVVEVPIVEGLVWGKLIMSKLRFRISMSLDGFIAGPNQVLKIHWDWRHATSRMGFSTQAFREMHGQSGGIVNESSAVVEEMFPELVPRSWVGTCLGVTPVLGSL